MASDDAGSVLKSPGAAESQRCIVGASPPRRRRDEPIAVTANHRQTKAAELKRLSGGGRGGGRRNSSVAPPLDIRKSGKGLFGFRRHSRQLQLEGDAVKKGAFYSTQVPLIRTKEAHNLLTQRSKGPDGGDGEPGCL